MSPVRGGLVYEASGRTGATNARLCRSAICARVPAWLWFLVRPWGAALQALLTFILAAKGAPNSENGVSRAGQKPMEAVCTGSNAGNSWHPEDRGLKPRNRTVTLVYPMGVRFYNAPLIFSNLAPTRNPADAYRSGSSYL